MGLLVKSRAFYEVISDVGPASGLILIPRNFARGLIL